MKEVKTLEDFKSLLSKPIMKFMKHEIKGEVFVFNERLLARFDFIDYNGNVSTAYPDNFTEIPELLEITKENCVQWAKSSDAIDREVLMDSYGYDVPTGWQYNSPLEKYAVRTIMPTKAETEATEEPLVDVVRAWTISKRCLK